MSTPDWTSPFAIVAATAVLRGVVDRVEVVVEHRLLGRGGTVGREAVVLLALELEWEQHVVGEPARFRLQRCVLLGQPKIHPLLLVSGSYSGSRSLGATALGLVVVLVHL